MHSIKLTGFKLGSTGCQMFCYHSEFVIILGTDGVEPTDFKTVWNLVSSVRREKRQAQEVADKEQRDEEHRKIMAEKRQRDIALRNELRMMGISGHAQRRPVKTELAVSNTYGVSS